MMMLSLGVAGSFYRGRSGGVCLHHRAGCGGEAALSTFRTILPATQSDRVFEMRTVQPSGGGARPPGR